MSNLSFTNGQTVQQLWHKYDCSKTQLCYAEAYEYLCGHIFRNAEARMLEIGVWAGASIKAFRELLGPKAHITAMDLDPDRAATANEIADVVYVGNQGDEIALQQVIAAGGGKWDLIIDDGSHSPIHQMISFRYLWPHIVIGGVYVIEDCAMNIKHPPRRSQAPVDYLTDIVRSNMRQRPRVHPKEYVCFCGQAIFIRKTSIG